MLWPTPGSGARRARGRGRGRAAPEEARVTTERQHTLAVRCLACGSADILPFLDLGSTPVANALLRTREEPAARYPLAVGVCTDCSLVQLLHRLPADAVFGADYPYFSSVSQALDDHSRAHCADLVRDGRVGADAFVVEVASNDGYLLRHLLPDAGRVLGIEPSPGPAQAAEQAGVPTLRAFLSPGVAAEVVERHGRADVVLANNVMAHVPDLRGFAEALALLLSDDGVLQVENPWFGWLLEHVEFDTIYHEHYSYFTTTAVDRLMGSVGLHLNDVEAFPALQGGTLRWTCSRRPGRTPALEAHLADEVARGLTGTQPHLAFGARVAALQAELRTLLGALKADGATLAAYGAAAKGATLLNSTGIGDDLLDYAVDLNRHKQGLWIPGCGLLVEHPEVLLERRPSHVLVLAWNYLDEVRAQQQAYEQAGGRWIVPVPWPTVLS
jgi:SAM-dependent methyltransferase